MVASSAVDVLARNPTQARALALSLFESVKNIVGTDHSRALLKQALLSHFGFTTHLHRCDVAHGTIGAHQWRCDDAACKVHPMLHSLEIEVTGRPTFLTCPACNAPLKPTRVSNDDQCYRPGCAHARYRHEEGALQCGALVAGCRDGCCDEECMCRSFLEPSRKQLKDMAGRAPKPPLGPRIVMSVPPLVEGSTGWRLLNRPTMPDDSAIRAMVTRLAEVDMAARETELRASIGLASDEEPTCPDIEENGACLHAVCPRWEMAAARVPVHATTYSYPVRFFDRA